MQSICSAATAAILTLASPAPCTASDSHASSVVASTTHQRLASHAGVGLPRLPALPKMPAMPKLPKVAPTPRPKWP